MKDTRNKHVQELKEKLWTFQARLRTTTSVRGRERIKEHIVSLENSIRLNAHFGDFTNSPHQDNISLTRGN